MADITYKIETVNTEDLSDFEKIDSYLRTLIKSVSGTIPGSRGFGLSAEISDLPPNEARNQFAMELDEKLEEYIPEIAVDKIETEEEDGATTQRIYIEGNNDYEEDDE